MKSFMSEFKEFISRGNVMDMAIGIIIGGAFTSIVTALVENIIMPLISLIFGGISFTKWNIAMGAGENAPVLGLGTFLSAIINFLLIAFVLFSVIKAINKMRSIAGAEDAQEEEEPTTKICPHCQSEVSIKATRCPFCTSEIE